MVAVTSPAGPEATTTPVASKTSMISELKIHHPQLE